MRHRNGIQKIGRTGSHRRATLRNLAIALFSHERIFTTHAKAKALRPFAERLITLGKRGDLAARRLAASRLNQKDAVQKLFDDLAGRFQNRDGGYTRILKVDLRHGDQAERVLIELVDGPAKAPVATEAAAS